MSVPFRALLLWGLVALAVPTAIVAIAEGAGQLRLPFNLHLVDLRLPVIFRLHMLTAGLALLLIPLVIRARRDSRLHKPLGRVAAVAVAIGGLTSIPVAVLSDSATAARLGFLAQGLVWLALLAAAVIAIRRRQVLAHARLMLTMAAVASGAIWVRLTTAVAVRCDVPFDVVYSAVAWLGWIVPMLLVWRLTRGGAFLRT